MRWATRTCGVAYRTVLPPEHPRNQYLAYDPRCGKGSKPVHVRRRTQTWRVPSEQKGEKEGGEIGEVSEVQRRRVVERNGRGMYNFVFEVFLQSVFDLSEPLRGEAPGPECLGIQLFGFMLALW